MLFAVAIVVRAPLILTTLYSVPHTLSCSLFTYFCLLCSAHSVVLYLPTFVLYLSAHTFISSRLFVSSLPGHCFVAHTFFLFGFNQFYSVFIIFIILSLFSAHSTPSYLLPCYCCAHTFVSSYLVVAIVPIVGRILLLLLFMLITVLLLGAYLYSFLSWVGYFVIVVRTPLVLLILFVTVFC